MKIRWLESRRIVAYSTPKTKTKKMVMLSNLFFFFEERITFRAITPKSHKKHALIMEYCYNLSIYDVFFRNLQIRNAPQNRFASHIHFFRLLGGALIKLLLTTTVKPRRLLRWNALGRWSRRRWSSRSRAEDAGWHWWCIGLGQNSVNLVVVISHVIMKGAFYTISEYRYFKKIFPKWMNFFNLLWIYLSKKDIMNNFP